MNTIVIHYVSYVDAKKKWKIAQYTKKNMREITTKRENIKIFSISSFLKITQKKQKKREKYMKIYKIYKK